MGVSDTQGSLVCCFRSTDCIGGTGKADECEIKAHHRARICSHWSSRSASLAPPVLLSAGKQDRKHLRMCGSKSKPQGILGRISRAVSAGSNVKV